MLARASAREREIAVRLAILVSALATYVPADRASRIDPMRALREE